MSRSIHDRRPAPARPAPAPARPAFAPARLAFAALAFAALAAPATVAPLGSTAVAAQANVAPRAATGGVTHVHGTSAELQGTINPRGVETSYYFQYGPTIAYGLQTPTTSVGKGTKSVAVGQTVANFPVGSHYRIVASNSVKTTYGRDRTFTATKGRLKFVMASTKHLPPTPYGGTFVLRGTLSGTGGALHPITAQISPYPFLTAFTALGATLTTDAAGAFAIPVRGLVQSMQLRVATSDARPLLSPIVVAHVSVRVTLKVRSSARKGLVRLYGTVTPAKVGAHVLFQVEKAIRPTGTSERESRFATQGSTIVKRGTRTVSRFSAILTVKKAGLYRAYVVLPSGPLVSGASPTVKLQAAPGRHKKK